MVNNIERWRTILSLKDGAVGEIASVENNVFEVYIYPVYYPKIRVGTILAVNSETNKAIGIILKLSHRSRLGGFTPLHRTRAEINQAYPDLDRYHDFVCTSVYTSHFNGENLFHYRASMPRLHDLVYIIEDSELLHDFFNTGNFEFIRYYILSGANLLEIREFLNLHSQILRKLDRQWIVNNLMRALLKAGVTQLAGYLEELSEIIGGWYE